MPQEGFERGEGSAGWWCWKDHRNAADRSGVGGARALTVVLISRMPTIVTSQAATQPRWLG